MNKLYFFVLALLSFFAANAQIVINELDCDTPGVDTEEFIELKSDTPNFALDGYVVVLFNGSSSGGNTSYFTIDLDGYQTDVNGLLLIGSSMVSPVPQYLIPQNVIQNGADAVAVYQGSDYDFLEYTLATTSNLVDVLIYGTNDAEATGFINIFNQHPDFTDIEQISEGAANNTNSIQRNNDDTYFTGTPTPRQLNDGSGVVLNGLYISIDEEEYDEGDTFDIIFTTEEDVNTDLVFDITLNNGTFDETDFTGNTTLTIPQGESVATTTITLIDDTEDEGDEELKIQVESLPAEYLLLNNNLIVRVVDNDFQVAPFGTPITPTYGVVQSTQPSGYYDSLDGLSGEDLTQAIQDIIANPDVVRAQTYADVIDILKEADQNPENSNQVWLVYLEEGRAKLDYQTGASNFGKWNREHTFPRSRGGFNSIEDDEIADGIDTYWTTHADSLRHANSDAHHIRASDGPENSARGNQFYGNGEYTGPTGTLGGFKGDVARSIFYLAIRYNDLEVVNGYPDGNVGQFGDLQTLLQWHENDPPDDYEMNRNNVVYTWQFNRNPFIDNPDLVDYIWGDNVGETWDASLGLGDLEVSTIQMFPNPASNYVTFKNVEENTRATILSMEGKTLVSKRIQNNRLTFDLSTGMYVVKLEQPDRVAVKKLVVK